MWSVGRFVRYENRVWRVGHVSELRMRLDPISPSDYKHVGTNKEIHIPVYGESVNVSPGSILPEVTRESLDAKEADRAVRMAERDPNSYRTKDETIVMSEVERRVAKMAAAGIPAVGKKVAKPAKAEAVTPLKPTVSANKVANAERKAKLVAANPATKASGNGEAKAEKAPKPTRPCVCGCTDDTGNRTMVTGYFAQGHDARFKSWMLKVERGELQVAQLPEVVQKAYKWIKTPTGYRADRHYNGTNLDMQGEPFTGYDKAATE